MYIEYATFSLRPRIYSWLPSNVCFRLQSAVESDSEDERGTMEKRIASHVTATGRPKRLAFNTAQRSLTVHALHAEQAGQFNKPVKNSGPVTPQETPVVHNVQDTNGGIVQPFPDVALDETWWSFAQDMQGDGAPPADSDEVSNEENRGILSFLKLM